MRTSDLDYELPSHLIATTPADPRDTAKLMVIDRASSDMDHQQVKDLPAILADRLPDTSSSRPGHSSGLMVFNQTRVLPAYFNAIRVKTGGKIKGLYVESSTGVDDLPCWQVALESRGKLRAGERIQLCDHQGQPLEHVELELVDRVEQGLWLAQLDGRIDSLALLQRVGHPPLPPYIRRQRRQCDQMEIQPEDTTRYNTIYATDPGSVAAPTAGLHFTPSVLQQLDQVKIHRAALTLHVGPGTFAPVRTAQLQDHPIHREQIHIPQATIDALLTARAAAGCIIPIGTTSVRALESLPQSLPAQGGYTAQTRLFITPPDSPRSDGADTAHDNRFPFRFTDGLMTNFHLPRSTLLALVAALPGVGLDRLKHWYRVAIEHEYRFYSYGDAMLIL